LLFAFVAGNTLAKLRINGELYSTIVQDMDLIADILPPPEYIVESYLIVLQALEEKDAATLSNALDRLKKLRDEFENRHAYWVKNLADGAKKDALVRDSYQPAHEFFALAEKKYFPAL
jgi:methyl-accepting chemotaxis protein